MRPRFQINWAVNRITIKGYAAKFRPVCFLPDFPAAAKGDIRHSLSACLLLLRMHSYHVEKRVFSDGYIVRRLVFEHYPFIIFRPDDERPF